MKKNQAHEFEIDATRYLRRNTESVRTHLCRLIDAKLMKNEVKVDRGIYKVTIEKVMTGKEAKQLNEETT